MVPNPSFEMHDTCPDNGNQINFATFWNNPQPYSSPDYFNACAIPPGYSVPLNIIGYEAAHSGVAYAGIVTAHLNPNTPNAWNAREYIQAELLDTLQGGINYCVSFYVSAGDSVYYTSNNIGIYFSQTEVQDTTCQFCNLTYTPQLENSLSNNIVGNGWTLISGNYTASGGEKYIVIGNFRDSANTQTTFIGFTSLLFAYYAFCYIDDVSISIDSTMCSGTGINEVNENELSLFPNPVTDKINITTKGNELVEANFFDVTGRKILRQSFTNSISINAEQLAKGIYLYEVSNKNGVIKKGKVVKN
ncbi:MAG: T9SS type A sorting domain-containing protein [Bacteroidia bacterium]